ncbi:MAG: MBL fold metallo-hydrolase [Acidobacteria bacterium]|nr:MBL fold metallo-hydrolase [Acidobacteriota bacterium]
MRLTFLGTGTSTGVPVIGCDCATCRSPDTRDRRWRPSIYLQLDDGPAVLIDASPDLRAQALRFDVRRVDMILFTHGHADHVLGLDDVRIYNFRQRAVIPCYGDARTMAGVRRMFAYVFDPATPRGGGLPQLALWPLCGPFSVAGRTIVPVPLWHGTLPVYGYRLGGLAYLTDCNAIPDTSWPLLQGLDVLVLDALRHRPHSTHFNVERAVEAATRIGARQTYFTHMTHDLPHAATCDQLPAGITLAHDGLVVSGIDEQLHETALSAAAGPAGL